MKAGTARVESPESGFLLPSFPISLSLLIVVFFARPKRKRMKKKKKKKGPTDDSQAIPILSL